MDFTDSNFYIALSESLTPDGAHRILERLADPEDPLRGRIAENPRQAFLEVGVDIGEELAPSEAVLPEAEEIRKALETFEAEGFRFELQPFGPFTPGKAPFGGILMLAAKANAGRHEG